MARAPSAAAVASRESPLLPASSASGGQLTDGELRASCQEKKTASSTALGLVHLEVQGGFSCANNAAQLAAHAFPALRKLHLRASAAAPGRAARRRSDLRAGEAWRVRVCLTQDGAYQREGAAEAAEVARLLTGCRDEKA
jgi:hypothetical protein